MTTLHLPPTLHASLRQLALMRGASFRTVVQQILDDYVTDDAAPRDVKEAVRQGAPRSAPPGPHEAGGARMTTLTKVRGQGRVYTRNGFLWIGYYHRGQQLRESVVKVTGKNTHAAATKLLRARTRTAGTPDFVTPANERLLVEPLLDLVVADYRRQGFRSLRDVERHVRRLAEHFAGWRAIDITTVTVNAYIDLRRDQGAANATINRETGVLRRGFRLAVQMKLLSENHRPTIQMLSEENAREGFLEPADFATLQACAPRRGSPTRRRSRTHSGGARTKSRRSPGPTSRSARGRRHHPAPAPRTARRSAPAW